MTYKKNF